MMPAPPTLRDLQKLTLVPASASGLTQRDWIIRNSRLLSPPVEQVSQDELRSVLRNPDVATSQVDILAWQVKREFAIGFSLETRKSIAAAVRAWRVAPKCDQARRFDVLAFVPQFYLMTGETERALRSCNLLEAWGKQLDYPAAIAAGSVIRASALRRTGQSQEAIRYLERARHICDWDLGNQAGMALCALMEAAAWRYVGNFSASRARVEQAAKLAIESEELIIYAGSLLTFGTLAVRQGDLRSALKAYKTAHQIASCAADQVRQFRTLTGIAFAQTRAGKSSPEADLAKTQAAIKGTLDPRDLSLRFEYLGDSYAQDRSTDSAALLAYRKALALTRRAQAHPDRLEVHRRIAEFWVERGNAHYASLHLARAQALRSDGTEAEDNHALDRIEQEVLWLNGDSKPALETLKGHAQQVADLGFGYENLLTSRRVVTIADSLGDIETANEWWARTEFVADACGALPLLGRWRDERQRLGYGSATAEAEAEAEATQPAESKASTQHPFPEEIPPVNLAEFGIVTRCRSLQDQGGWLARIALTGLPILIRGESGTGKELFARLVHDLSPRKDNAFLAVNCAALPGEIMESELYGHRRGAFTGAMNDKPGLFMLADNGTLFLDEIGEMAPTLQAKLLRTIESGELRPVGDTRTHRVDVRIVAATNVNLEAAVAKGKFREDLYYRLRGFEISLPPLRDRLEDVEPLARFFLDKANRRLGKSLTLPPQTAQWLMGHPWPGNVRELKFTVEQAVGLAGRTSALVPGHFIASRHTAPAQRSLPEELEEIERSRILGALRVTDWSVAEAARLLGMGRTTLSGKLKRLGLERPGG